MFNLTLDGINLTLHNIIFCISRALEFPKSLAKTDFKPITYLYEPPTYNYFPVALISLFEKDT